MIKLFLCVILLVAVGSSSQETPALITITPQNWDFGKLVDTTEMVQKDFVIKNNSEETITLNVLPTSCGCMVAKPVPDVLPPHTEAQLKTLFVPKGMRGIVQWEIKLDISPKIGNQQLLIVPLQANVMLDSLLSEWIANFRVFKRSAAKPITLWMTNHRQQNFKLLEVTTDVTSFDISSQELSEVTGFFPGPQRGYRIDITPKADIPYGRNNGKIYLKTDIPGKEKIEIPLFAHVIPEIAAVPDYISFGVMKPGKKITKQVVVSRRELAKFQILSCKSSIPFISSTLQTVVPDIYYYVHITLDCPENATPGEFRGTFSIETDCEEQREVIVNLQGIVLP